MDSADIFNSCRKFDVTQAVELAFVFLNNYDHIGLDLKIDSWFLPASFIR